jgi:ABC-type dipeptide/oligopeptide/nickel transport system permease component
MMVTVTLVICVNLAVDILYSVLDPRVDLTRAKTR